MRGVEAPGVWKRRVKFGCLGTLLGLIAFIFVPQLLIRAFSHGGPITDADEPDPGFILLTLACCVGGGLLIGLVMGWKEKP